MLSHVGWNYFSIYLFCIYFCRYYIYGFRGDARHSKISLIWICNTTLPVLITLAQNILTFLLLSGRLFSLEQNLVSWIFRWHVMTSQKGRKLIKSLNLQLHKGSHAKRWPPEIESKFPSNGCHSFTIPMEFYFVQFLSAMNDSLSLCMLIRRSWGLLMANCLTNVS